MMEIRGRTFLAAVLACLLSLLLSAASHPSSNSEAGRAYSIARERLADLKKFPKKKKYRSYWMDCARSFELVEKKYPESPAAADACFDRAELYLDLYRFNLRTRDAAESAKVYEKCQAAHPNHSRAPEALFRAIEVHKSHRKDGPSASKIYAKLSAAYPESEWTSRAKARLGLNGSSHKRKKTPEIRKPPEPVIAAPAAQGTVKGIRYWSGGAYTRIVIDQDKPLRFQATELKNPDRLVFDLLGARIDDSINKDPLPVNDGILRQVRASQYDPGTVRVVLDLASLKSYAAFPLHEPERLVIDVTGENPEGRDFGTEAGEPDGQAEAEPGNAPAISSPPLAQSPKPGADARSDGKLSLSRQLGLKIRTIAIDAGHGGHDPGAIGRGGLKEKNVTLDVAKRLAELVREKLNCNVVMTRDRDVYIDLEARPLIAKSKKADLFVSIHVNASRKKRTRGIETYIQGLRASDKDAMATAARENATTSKKLNELDSELTKILKGLSKSDDDEESIYLAHSVQGSLVNTMKPVQGHVVNLGVKRAFFYVLINTEMPSILAEVGFISNPEEEKLLKTESYRQAIAEALFEGVRKYVASRNQQMAGI
jgi:N-acetylmuramoyl-L-alanine amidase